MRRRVVLPGVDPTLSVSSRGQRPRRVLDKETRQALLTYFVFGSPLEEEKQSKGSPSKADEEEGGEGSFGIGGGGSDGGTGRANPNLVGSVPTPAPSPGPPTPVPRQITATTGAASNPLAEDPAEIFQNGRALLEGDDEDDCRDGGALAATEKTAAVASTTEGPDGAMPSSESRGQEAAEKSAPAAGERGLADSGAEPVLATANMKIGEGRFICSLHFRS